MQYNELKEGDWFTINEDTDKDVFYLLFNKLNKKAIMFEPSGRFKASIRITKEVEVCYLGNVILPRSILINVSDMLS